MKKAWFLLVMMGIVAAPALCLAGAPPDQRPVLSLASLGDSELAHTTGQGCQLQANLKNQEGRIVIWDEWASAGRGSKAVNGSFTGQVSINYGLGQATMSVGNAPR